MEIQLRLERDAVVAGERVVTHLQIDELASRTEGGRIELVYRNFFLRTAYDREGSSYLENVYEDVVVASAPIDAYALHGGVRQFAVVLPADAPPTARASIEWRARVVLERSRARDAQVEAPLHVRAPATALLAWAATAAEERGRHLLTLECEFRVRWPGQPLRGRLTISPTSTLRARSVRVQLHRLRQDPRGEVWEEFPVVLPLAGETVLQPGQPLVLPFTLQLPADASPSFTAAHTSQHWFVEAVVDRALRTDASIQLEVVVATA